MKTVRAMDDIQPAYSAFLENNHYPKLESLSNWGKNRFFFSLYFKLIDFPVFNVADCYITVAAIVLILISIICLKNNELDYLTSSRKKWQVEDEGK